MPGRKLDLEEKEKKGQKVTEERKKRTKIHGRVDALHTSLTSLTPGFSKWDGEGERFKTISHHRVHVP